jgi:uncharacterized protein (TIGR03437 family)
MSHFFRIATLFLIAGAVPMMAQPGRIPGRIDASRRTMLRGQTHPRALPEFDQGPLDPSTRLSPLFFLLKRTPAQQAGIERLLADQQDASSPEYHNWLTPEQFGDRFGISQADMDKIVGWLSAAGFTIDYVARSRTAIGFSGTAEQVRNAFRAPIHRYLVDGRMHFGAASEPWAPEAIAPMIAMFGGLDDLPRSARKPQPRPLYTNPSDGAHYLTPGDLATIYNINPLYQIGITGAGQTIAVVGASDIKMSDMQTARTTFGLPQNDAKVVVVPGYADPGFNGAESEADLDLQMVGGIAPNATLIYVTSTVFVYSAEYAVDQNLAPIISMSFGTCASQVSSQPLQFADAYRALAQQANAQGITWVVSSGDTGAAGCDYGGPTLATKGLDVNIFAAVPEVTGVGGTTFNEGSGNYWNSSNSSTAVSARSYIPEKAWNSTASMGKIWSTGGGVCTYFTKPSWQTGPGVPNDNARDVPDIALAAAGDHDGYLVYNEGNIAVIGGTSASAPVFAGIVALLNQYLVSTGKQSKPGLGNINPNLYHLASTNPGVFHDVTVGDNIVPCQSGTKDCTSGQFGYKTGPGYDLATGWGSVDAYKLITNWSGSTVTATATTATANPTSIPATASTTLTATVKASGGTLSPAGTVTFSAGGTTLGSGSLSGSGGTSTTTLTVSGSQLSIGANSIAVAYGGATGFSASSGTVTVTVTAPTGGPTTTTLTASPASIAATASTVLTASVKASSGSTSPSGTVTFMRGNATLGTANLSGSGGSATATLTVNGSQLATGLNNLGATYAGSGGFGGSTGTTSVTVTVSATATTTTVSASPSSIASTGNTVITATVNAAAGTSSPGGSVAFTLGGATLGSAALSGSGGTSSASITVGGSQLASGNNTIAASYSGGSGFGASSGTVVVNVSASAAIAGTTASATASPASITTNMTTVITATVKASSGAASPSGQISFLLGKTSLGTAALAGSGGTATASLTVYGSRLSVGANTIGVSYGGGSGFNPSSASVAVTVTVPTTSSAVIPSVVPSPVNQQATDSDGYSWFYTVRIAEIAGVASTITGFSIDGYDYSSNVVSWFGTANLSAHGALLVHLRAKSLNVPVNRTFTFTGTDANGQAWTQQLLVPFMPQQTSASMLITSSPGTVVQNPAGVSGCDPDYQFYQELNLQEQNGYAVQLTKLTAGGHDLSANIPDWFGTWRLAPLGALQADMCWSIDSPPETLTYGIEGVDAAGNKIAATASFPFNPPPAQPGGTLSASKSEVDFAVQAGQRTSSSVAVKIAAGQPWTVSVFPANQKTTWLVVYPLSGTGPGTVNLIADASGVSTGFYYATLVLQSVNTIPQFYNVGITFTVGGSSNVSIAAITNHASGQQAFAPGMIADIWGSNLAKSTAAQSGAPLPLTLAGVSASVNGVPAPLYYVSPYQMDIQIPYEIPTGDAVLAVNNNGQVATYGFQVDASAPGIWADANGSLLLTPNAARGQALIMFITGEGDVTPYVTTGSLPSGQAITTPPKPRLPFSMTVGGVPVTPLFVGIPSWSIGLTQVNFIVPNSVSLGWQPVVVTVGDASSAPVYLNVTSASAHVRVGFESPFVAQASDGQWHYTATLEESQGVGVNLTKLVVFGNDYTSQIESWFGATRLPANGVLSGGFTATCEECQTWDGAWQLTGIDDAGNVETWSGTVRFLPPAAHPSIQPRAAAASRGHATSLPDDIAPAPEPAAAQPSADASPLFELLMNSGAVRPAPPKGAANIGTGSIYRR